MIKLLAIKLILIFLLATSSSKLGNYHSQASAIPIYFEEYDITINEFSKLGDTLLYNVSNKEYFKFVFSDYKGRCYCERYLNKKLYEKGNYANSLDTLKRYVSGRASNGKDSPITVESFFQPLKNGEWIIYKKGKKTKKIYLMGMVM